MKLIAGALIVAPAILGIILSVMVLARSTSERLTGLLVGGSGAAITLIMLLWGMLPDPNRVWSPDDVLLQYVWEGLPMALIGAPATAVGVLSRRWFLTPPTPPTR
jgi:hypothetical protein